ncbi:MAG: sulfatase [Planctomycetota bacterium]
MQPEPSTPFIDLVLSKRLIVCCLLVGWPLANGAFGDEAGRPNILIAVSDDQSFPHASAYGCRSIRTPAFDRIAKEGVLFNAAFTPAPGCSPMRAAFLTGREIWMIREAGTHASTFPDDLPVFTKQLAESGYHVGATGKGWGPGKAIGWEHNPAGKSYQKRNNDSPKGVSSTDYAENFRDFLKSKPEQSPFCFWFGGHEPHRVFDKGIGEKNGIDAAQIDVPRFLPDVPEVRSDLADYFFEIQWFDRHLMRMLDQLESNGELENTLVIVTSDNGMSFPRAKANLYEFGIHMPLAMSWPKRIPAGQVNDDLVTLLDIAPTIFAASRVTPREAERLAGFNLLPRLSNADDSAPLRAAVFSGRERHSSSRYNSLGYPSRCVRTEQFLYIRNFKPERFPAGAPQKYAKASYNEEGSLVASKLGPEHGGYHDIDACPTFDWMIRNRADPRASSLFQYSVGLRPHEELFDIRKDPSCLNNLAEDSMFQRVRDQHRVLLDNYLKETGDLRLTDPDAANVWETYQRVSGLRWFPKPDWASENPASVPRQPWLELRRPR